MNNYLKLTKQITFFVLVGAITFLIDLSVTAALYYLLHLPAYLSSGIGFLSGFFFNFPMNRKKVFQHSNKDQHSLKIQLILYASLCIFNLIATSGLTELFVSSGLLTIAYAKIVITAFIATWNFIIFKLFIFSKKNADSTNDH